MQPVIAGYARTPFHRAHKGALREVRPEDLAATSIQRTIESTALDVDAVEDLMMGCAYPEGVQGLNIGRIATYLSGLPHTVPGMTTNRLCGSSMQVVHTAAGSISMGSGDLFVCAGVETMSLVQRGGWNRDLHPGLESSPIEAYVNMGITAENLASSHGISRADQEAFAAASHTKAISAQEGGHFDGELVAIQSPDGLVESDGCMRAPNLEKMATLRPAFIETGTVTAATSSPLTDGAASMIVTSSAYASEHGIDALATIEATAVAGVAPEIMGYGPVPATQKVLDRAGISMDDLDVIELNEAFSAQALACMMDLGLDADDARVNIDGGALAIGHPLGASGARITGKAASLLQRTGGEYGLATMCIGGGMGIATLLRRADG